MDPNNEPVTINMYITGRSFSRSRSLNMLRHKTDIKIYKGDTEIIITNDPAKRKVIFETLILLVNKLTYIEKHPSGPSHGSRINTFNSPPTLCLGRKYRKGNVTIRVFKKDGKRLGAKFGDVYWNIVLVTVVTHGIEYYKITMFLEDHLP